MSKLQIKNISKNFGNTKVLDDINLNVSQGEFTVLVGPSGSGKSTILRIIAGLENATSGEIEINGKVINNLQPKDRDIAMVFQNYALYPHMNVFENLAFPLRMRNISSETIKKSVYETSELLGIKHYLEKKPKELSGGERQRIALGRAIIRKPQLFLMDEPLSNLDAKLRTQMRAELLKLHKTLSTTVIYVTHDQIEALTMGNKIVVLNHGVIQQTGSPSEVYHLPSNIFVGGFIGNPPMNFFNVKITDDLKFLFLGELLQEIKLSEKLLSILKSNGLINKALVLGVRPEHVYIKHNSEKSPNEISLNATIDLLEMLGNEYLIYANTTNQAERSSFSIKAFENKNYTRNSNITAAFNLDKALFFDKTSGKIINT